MHGHVNVKFVLERVHINLKSREILGNLINHSADYEIYRLLSCEVMSFGIYRDLPTFRKETLHPIARSS
jgi:hypothetical protein